MDRKTDVREYKPGSPGSGGVVVESTEMLKGKGALKPAQTGSNTVEPYDPGSKQPGTSRLGGS